MNITHSRKHLIVILIIISVALEFGFCGDSMDTPLELSFELRDLESVRFRLSGSSIETVLPQLSNMRLVLLGITANIRSPEQQAETGIRELGFNYLDLGIAGPYFKIGPVYICGLLREIDNPLGYSPWSDVRVEYTGLKLNGSFPLQASSNRGSGYLNIRHGISYSIFPDTADIYAYRKGRLINGGSPLHLGIITRLEILPEVSFGGKDLEGKAEILSALTEPFTLKDYQMKEADSAEEWYPDDLIFPGGKLLHLGSRFSFTCDSLKDTQGMGAFAGGEKLSIYYSLIGSNGTLIKPGFLSEGFASWETITGKLGFFGGYRSEDYRDTNGGANRNMYRINANLQLFPLKTGELTLDYEGLLKYPGFAQGEFIEGEEKISSNISWLLFPGFKGRTIVSIGGEKRLSYSKDGRTLENNGLTAAFLYSSEHTEKDEKSGIGINFDILENTFGFKYYTGGNKVVVNVSNPFSKYFSFNALYSAYFYSAKYRFHWAVKTKALNGTAREAIRFKTRDIFSYLTVSLGWETRR